MLDFNWLYASASKNVPRKPELFIGVAQNNFYTTLSRLSGVETSTYSSTSIFSYSSFILYIYYVEPSTCTSTGSCLLRYQVRSTNLAAEVNDVCILLFLTFCH